MRNVLFFLFIGLSTAIQAQNIDSLQAEAMKLKSHAKTEIIGGSVTAATSLLTIGTAYIHPPRSQNFYFSYFSGLVGLCTGLITLSIGIDDAVDHHRTKKAYLQAKGNGIALVF